MITKYKRNHYIYTKFKKVFDSDEFKDFSIKMMQHLAVREKSDPNKLGTLTETVLPFVNTNLQNVNMAVHKIDGTVNQLSQDVTNMAQDLNTDLVDIKDDINSNVTGQITVIKEVFKEELSKSSSVIHDQMKMQLANWNYKQADSLVAHADEILMVTSGDHNDSLQIVGKGCPIEKKVTTSIINLPAKRSIDEISKINGDDQKYKIPDSFHSFNSIIDHYYNDVEPYEKAGHGHKWRTHLTKAEKRRFTRMKRVITAFRKKLLVQDDENVKEQFEGFYTLNNKSLAKLADVYSKNIIASDILNNK